MLYFEHVRPATVLTDWLKYITVNGAAAENGTNVRVCTYRYGCAVLPHTPSIQPLTLYTEKNYGGKEISYSLNTYYNKLGEMDNAARSFKLKRGYACILANNADGTGYSRYFVADQEDLNVTDIPALLRGKVSFVRVFVWDWPSKRGFCDTKGTAKGDKLNSTWYYSWGAGYQSTPNQQYVPGKEQKSWPSNSTLEAYNNVSHLYTYTEPDNPVAADRYVMPRDAAAAWPGLLKTGLRIGAPAYIYNSNSYEFIRLADSLNYRVDFVEVHCYWGGKTARQWYNDLHTIWVKCGKRPLWIKEWNNGANWTTETWPTSFTDKLAKQYSDMKAILNVLDTASFVERYSVYNWVGEYRAMILDTPDASYEASITKQQAVIDTTTNATKKAALVKTLTAYKQLYQDVKTYRDKNGELTPAGIYYRDSYDNVPLAWRPCNEVIPKFTFRSPENPTATYNFSTKAVTVKWVNANGEETDSVQVERALEDGIYVKVATIIPSTDKTSSIVDSLQGLPNGTYMYRIRNFDCDGAERVSSTPAVVYDFAGTGTAGFQYGRINLYNTDFAYTTFEPLADNVQPVVYTGPSTFTNRNTLLCEHVALVSTNKFKFQLLPFTSSASQDMTSAESCNFVVAKPGDYNIGNIKIEAATLGDRVGSDTVSVLFKEPFAEGTVPVVFPSVISSLGTYPYIPKIWDVSATGFKMKVMRESQYTGYQTKQAVSYIAASAGSAQLPDGKMLTVGHLATKIGGSIQQFFTLTDDEGGKYIMTNPLMYIQAQTNNADVASILRCGNPICREDSTRCAVIRQLDPSNTNSVNSASRNGDIVGWMTISDTAISTGITTLNEDSAPRVMVNNGRVSLSTSDAFSIYNAAGMKMNGEGKLPTGFYVVKSGTHTFKIWIK
jgi:hypothetical protein